jgi:hypothetical protein
VLDHDDDISTVAPERFTPGRDTRRADEHCVYLSATGRVRRLPRGSDSLERHLSKLPGPSLGECQDRRHHRTFASV